MTIQPISLTRVAVAISIAVHLAAVAVSLGYAGAGLFKDAVPEAVPVSLVTPEEAAEAAPTPPPQKDAIDLAKLDLRPSSPDSQQSQGTPSDPPAPASKTTSPASPPQQQAALQPMPQPQIPQPAYAAPKPDLSLRYQVDLGLKALAAPSADGSRNGNSDFDDQAVNNASVDASGIRAFRNRLKDCGALPASIQPDDKVVIVIRATFTPDGRLANTPALIEASASAKGPALMQAAVAALQKCQPHTTLPADKYTEWRVLDLRFTPRDFTKG